MPYRLMLFNRHDETLVLSFEIPAEKLDAIIKFGEDDPDGWDGDYPVQAFIGYSTE